MAVRSTMADLITLVRTMINDPSSASQQFSDQQIQDRLDASRDDIRYENLQIAPTITNTASTNNSAQTIFADYYSQFQWWEADVVLQGLLNGAAWKVLTPLASDLITGRWQFELDPFNTGTVPGQVPPVFATGKVFDPNMAAADLLEFWAATTVTAYDFTSDGQTFRRSQMMQARLTMAQFYRRQARPRVAKMHRDDAISPLDTRRMRLLDSDIEVR